ncbi:hypothetical protein JZ751_022045 [Albula glossodonta]|uniref:Impact N-terminal domain-containing protein n=1 Tax=Albula glossodonta TaxID=121402 RepID=A0A8T2NIP8_9TELE|nr:hypothetical protein JZ751_022045 [Albula glossodonta]
MVLDKLYENKKIASATHNIYAYRIYCEDKQTFLQDCEDDGETAAGGRLLHLLQILDVRNVMVVVSRWYGGILLGPDRFKHINNCARNILVENYKDLAPGPPTHRWRIANKCVRDRPGRVRLRVTQARRNDTAYVPSLVLRTRLKLEEETESKKTRRQNDINRKTNMSFFCC